MNAKDFAKELTEMFDGVEISDADLERIAGGTWEDLDAFFKGLRKKYGDKLDIFYLRETITKEEYDKFEELYREAKGK